MKNIKKIISVLLIIASAVSLCSCGRGNLTVGTETTDCAAQENFTGSTEDVTIGVCDKAENQDIKEPQATATEKNTEKITEKSTEKNTQKTEATTKNNSVSTTLKNETAANTETTTKKAPAETTTKKQEEAYISVSCGTILGNMDKLKDGKEYFVPANGVIIGKTGVKVQSGDTAFDILKRVCENSGVQFEYSYSAGFGTYYIEGINQIYEKDCGSKSGWLYKVNGVFPSEGSSSYKVKAGDVIEFVFTCDMGADVGA